MYYTREQIDLQAIARLSALAESFGWPKEMAELGAIEALLRQRGRQRERIMRRSRRKPHRPLETRIPSIVLSRLCLPRL